MNQQQQAEATHVAVPIQLAEKLGTFLARHPLGETYDMFQGLKQCKPMSLSQQDQQPAPPKPPKPPLPKLTAEQEAAVAAYVAEQAKEREATDTNGAKNRLAAEAKK